MHQLRHRVIRLFQDRRGVTAAEYAVVALGIVIAVAAAATLFGNALSNSFSRVTAAF